MSDPLSALSPTNGQMLLYSSGASCGAVTKAVSGSTANLSATPVGGSDPTINLFTALPGSWSTVAVKGQIQAGHCLFGLCFSGSDGGFASAYTGFDYTTNSNGYEAIIWGELGVFSSKPIATTADPISGPVWVQVASDGTCSISSDGSSFTSVGTISISGYDHFGVTIDAWGNNAFSVDIDDVLVDNVSIAGTGGGGSGLGPPPTFDAVDPGNTLVTPSLAVAAALEAGTAHVGDYGNADVVSSPSGLPAGALTARTGPRGEFGPVNGAIEGPW